MRRFANNRLIAVVRTQGMFARKLFCAVRLMDAVVNVRVIAFRTAGQ